MNKTYTVLFALLAASLLQAAQADELTAAKKADIVKMLSLNGTERVVEPFAMMVTQSYMQQLRNCNNCSPKIPDVVRATTQATLSAHVNGEGGLIERQVPVYHQHFSHAEIKQMLAFYSSPIGRKLVAASNELTRGNIEASQQWLTEVAPEVKQRVDAALTKAGIKPTLPGSPPPSVLQSSPK
ncbi:MAG: hypothetical protein JWL63_2649 [Rhodocyclales bacterium]|nr:hypothetical protein [Rhodocyclales bacterium]